MTDLSAGDFLYQSDQELFLCVTGENDGSYNFAVHGWREIDKERIDEYIENSRSKVHRQNEIENLIDEKGDDSKKEQFDKLKQLFNVYEDVELPKNGPNDDFALKEK